MKPGLRRSVCLLSVCVCLSLSHSSMKTTFKLVLKLRRSESNMWILVQGSLQCKQWETNQTAHPCSSTSHLMLLFLSDNRTEKQGVKISPKKKP